MKHVKSILFVTVIALAQACNSGDSSDSVTAANNANEKKDSGAMVKMADTAMSPNVNTTPVDKDAANFAVNAADGGMMEVQLGNYAQQNGVSKRVKDFGAMMVKDHTKASEELKGIAQTKNITLPGSIGRDAQKEMDNLMKKKGGDFDKAYMSMMLDDHKKDVKEFEKAAKECKDPEIKSFAGKTLPVLLIHLDSAQAITGKQ